MTTKTQTKKSKPFLTGFTPSTDAEILQRMETTKALLQSITSIEDVNTIIPDLMKWEWNEIEMKYPCEVSAVSDLVRDCTVRLKDKYFQETGEFLPPIQNGSSLNIRVGWLLFVDIYIIDKELQTDAENIAAAVSRDSAAMQHRQGNNKKLPSRTRIILDIVEQNPKGEFPNCIRLTKKALQCSNRTTTNAYIKKVFYGEKATAIRDGISQNS